MTSARATETPMRPLGVSPATQWLVSDGLVDMTRKAQPPLPLRLAAEPQDVVIDTRATALVIIDMQNDFCAPGGWLDHIGVDVAPARQPIGPLRTVLPALRSAAVPVVWVNWGNRPDLLNLSPALLHVYKPPAKASVWATHCRATAPRCCNAAAGRRRSWTSSRRWKMTCG